MIFTTFQTFCQRISRRFVDLAATRTPDIATTFAGIVIESTTAKILGYYGTYALTLFWV